MNKRVLVPYDGSPQSKRALEFVLTEWGDDEIVLLHVIDPIEAGYSVTTSMSGGAEQWYQSAQEESTALLSEASLGVACNVRTETRVGRPARTILEVAESEGFDHIVMGSHGRTGVSRIFVGSVTESVVRGSPVPVTVVR